MILFVTNEQAAELDLSEFKTSPYKIRCYMDNEDALLEGLVAEGEFEDLAKQEPKEFFVEVKRDFWVSFQRKGK